MSAEIIFNLLPVGMVALVVIVVLVVLRNPYGKYTRDQSLLQSGQLATARVLRMWQTNSSMGDKPQICFVLEVQPLQAPAFQAEAKAFVSLMQLVQLKPGMSVEVRFDPDDKTRVGIASFISEGRRPARY